jgi:hypothetical protein
VQVNKFDWHVDRKRKDSKIKFKQILVVRVVLPVKTGLQLEMPIAMHVAYLATCSTNSQKDFDTEITLRRKSLSQKQNLKHNSIFAKHTHLKIDRR